MNDEGVRQKAAEDLEATERQIDLLRTQIVEQEQHAENVRRFLALYQAYQPATGATAAIGGRCRPPSRPTTWSLRPSGGATDDPRHYLGARRRRPPVCGAVRRRAARAARDARAPHQQHPRLPRDPRRAPRLGRARRRGRHRRASAPPSPCNTRPSTLTTPPGSLPAPSPLADGRGPSLARRPRAPPSFPAHLPLLLILPPSSRVASSALAARHALLV